MRSVFFIQSILFFCVTSGLAQQTTIFTEEYRLYQEGLDLYDKEKYTAAQHKFNEQITYINDHNDEVVMNCRYYSAMCAMELYNTDAEFLFREFVKAYPESPRLQKAYLSLGQIYYRKKEWDEAILWYEKVDIYLLSPKELAEYRFKKGYAYFSEQQIDKASAEFREIKDIESQYQNPALYYYSHIAYEKKNYQVALEGFLKLRDKTGFDRIVPYYITQIYFLQKKYEDVISYGAPLLDTAKPQRLADVANLVGDSYYRLKKYDEAVTYLEIYAREAGKQTPEERYRLAYSYFMEKNYENAAKNFEKTARNNSELGQVSLYYLAQCYEKIGEKIYARNAYNEAAEMGHDPEITEDALFRYAELAYELSNNPYDEAIMAFQTYLSTYPKSPRADDAYQYLINVYMTTRNYKAALESLDKVEKSDIRLRSAYQMVVFNYAVGLYANGNIGSAIDHFKKVKTYPIDEDLNARSLYWIGECFYAQKKFPEARHWYNAFLKEPGAFSTELYGVAHYNIAYAWLEDSEHDKAIAEFRQYISRNDKDVNRMNDAYLRIADNYYRVKKDDQAIEYYDKSIKLNVNQQDYALFQKGLSLGYQGKHTEKIGVMKKILDYYPSGDFVARAKYEIGEAYRVMNKPDQAIKYYVQVIEQFPKTNVRRMALLSLAQMYYLENQLDKAIETYMAILQEKPNADECKSAIFGLKDVYARKNDLERWEKIARGYNCVNIDELNLDSTQFAESVQTYWVSGDCEKINENVDKYLNRYPNGLYRSDALYYKAECLYFADLKDESLVYYDKLIEQAVNEYTETALIRAASMYYERKEYAKALKNYEGLESHASNTENRMISFIGMMRCNYLLENYEQTKQYALLVIKGENVKTTIREQAELYYGMSMYYQEDYDNAIKELSALNKKTTSVMGAEARYYIAHIYYLKTDYKEVENQILALIKQKPAYDYWVAKGYILLADNFIAQDNLFQAKHTLQSIIDNYTAKDDIVPTAQQKLAEINAMEKKQDDGDNTRSMELDMGGSESIKGSDPTREENKKDE